MKYWWCFLLVSCTPWIQQPDIASVPDFASIKGKDVVVFIHGYYGSALREPYGERRFLRIPPILFGHYKIGMFPETLGIKAPKLEVEGMISHFPLSVFYSIDVYGQGMRALSNENQIVVPFAYDWRQDLVQSSGELTDFLKKLETYDPKRIHLFAHSMGGMVALYSYLYGKQEPTNPIPNQNWKKVSSITTLGTPFRGAMSILRNMHVGTGYSWNPSLLEAETVASFPASYYLLPLMQANFFSENQKVAISLADIALWKEQRIGLLKDPSHPQYAARLAFTEANLRRARDFQRALQVKLKLPLFQLVGKGTPTLAFGEKKQQRWAFRQKDADNYAQLLTDGDGTVPLESALLPDPMVEKIQYTNIRHDKVFLDPEFLKTFAEWKETK